MGLGLGLAMAGDASDAFKQGMEADQDRAETMLQRDYKNHQLAADDSLVDPTTSNKLTDLNNTAALQPVKQQTAMAGAQFDAGMAGNKLGLLPIYQNQQTYQAGTGANNAQADNTVSQSTVKAAPYVGDAKFNGSLTDDQVSQLKVEAEAGRALQGGDPDTARWILNQNPNILGGKVTDIQTVTGKDTNGNKAGFYRMIFDDGSQKDIPASMVQSLATQYAYGAKQSVVPMGSTMVTAAPGMPTQTDLTVPYTRPVARFGISHDGSTVIDKFNGDTKPAGSGKGLGTTSRQNTQLLQAASKLAATHKDPNGTDNSEYQFWQAHAPAAIESLMSSGQSLSQATQSAETQLQKQWAIKTSRGGNAAPGVDISSYLK